MKESDAILRIKPELDLLGNVERQIRFAQPDFARILKQSREMELFVSKNPLVTEKLCLDLASSPLTKELTIASRAIAAVQMSPEFKAFATNAARMSEVTATIGMELCPESRPAPHGCDRNRTAFRIANRAPPANDQ